jgi:hypothetical protein
VCLASASGAVFSVHALVLRTGRCRQAKPAVPERASTRPALGACRASGLGPLLPHRFRDGNTVRREIAPESITRPARHGAGDARAGGFHALYGPRQGMPRARAARVTAAASEWGDSSSTAATAASSASCPGAPPGSPADGAPRPAGSGERGRAGRPGQLGDGYAGGWSAWPGDSDYGGAVHSGLSTTLHQTRVRPAFRVPPPGAGVTKKRRDSGTPARRLRLVIGIDAGGEERRRGTGATFAPCPAPGARRGAFCFVAEMAEESDDARNDSGYGRAG